MNYPTSCSSCGHKVLYCAERVWNKVVEGDPIQIVNTDGFTGETVCGNCGMLSKVKK